jgi:peptidyl-prolyl cis-trans isomerase D
MLDIMRRKKRLKLILWLVIISLGMGMLLLFVPGQNVGIQGFDTFVASVAGEEITPKDYTDAYRRFVENYSAGGKNKTDSETLKRLGVDKQTLNALIQVRVVSYAAKKLGLDVTTEEVAQAIESTPSFRNQAGFIGVDAYKGLLAANRIDVDLFEAGMHSTLLGRKISSVLTDSLSIPEKQVREGFARQNQEAQVQYVLFEKDAAKKKINPTEAELQAYFDANKDKYHGKEERRAQYLLLPINEISATIKVTDRDIDEQWAKMNHEETVDASHILLKVEDPSKDAEVKAKAEALLKRAKAGEDFADLARKNSQDEGSAAQGGNLGPFPRGRMVKAFEDVAFSLKKDEISGLVRSDFGYHIIKVLAHDIPNKEASRASMIKTIQVDKAAELAKQKALDAQKLLAKEKDLNVVAKALNMPTKVLETVFFSRSTDAYANGLTQEFIDEVFSLKEVNTIGKPVEFFLGQAVPKLIQINLPKPPDFKTALELVKKDYLEVKAGELMIQQAQKLAEDAKSLNDLAKAAQKIGAVIKTSDSFKRDGTPSKEIGSAPDFTAAAFGLAVGGVSGPITIGGGKQVAVLQVKSLSPFNEAEYAKQKGALKEQLLSSARETYFEEYIRMVTEELNKARKIRINTTLLDQLSSYRY